MTRRTGSTTQSHLLAVIGRAVIPRVSVRALRRPFISGAAPFAWPIALGPLAVEMSMDDLACGPLGPTLFIPRLPTILTTHGG